MRGRPARVPANALASGHGSATELAGRLLNDRSILRSALEAATEVRTCLPSGDEGMAAASRAPGVPPGATARGHADVQFGLTSTDFGAQLLHPSCN